jgi:hypothetical protein
MTTPSGSAYYRQLADGSWARQDGGGPAQLSVQVNTNTGLFGILARYDGGFAIFTDDTFATTTAAQTALNNYVATLNAGTA